MNKLAEPDANSFVSGIVERLKNVGDINPKTIGIHRLMLNGRRCLVVEMPPALRPVEASLIALYQGTTDLHRRHRFYPASRLTHYFTLERPVSPPSADCPSIFCAWDEDTHFNFGPGPMPTVEDFGRSIQAALFENNRPPRSGV